MRSFTLVLTLVLVAMMPVAALAQKLPPAPVPPQQEAIQGLSAGKILAIGVGAVAGAVLLDFLLAADAAPLVGGIVGGYIGNWWYNNNGDPSPRANIRLEAGAPRVVRLEQEL